MASAWVVSANGVTLNGSAIPNYVSHRFSFINTTEGTSDFEGCSLVVRVIDTPSDTARTNALAAASTHEKALYAAENANRQTVRDIRPQSGDTVTVTLGTITYVQNQVQSADVGGVMQL